MHNYDLKGINTIMVDFAEFALVWVFHNECESREICENTQVRKCCECWQLASRDSDLENQHKRHNFRVIQDSGGQIEWILRNLLLILRVMFTNDGLENELQISLNSPNIEGLMFTWGVYLDF